MTLANSTDIATDHAPPGFLPWVAELVHTHRRVLVDYARRQGLGADDALDVVQDGFATFLKLPQGRSLARSGDDAIKMLHVLVRNNVSNLRRKTSRRSQTDRILAAVEEDLAETSHDLIVRAEEIARINGCVLKMARLQQDVIRLSLVDTEPAEVVARELGITASHVRVLVHRARERIRSCAHEES